MSDTQGNKLYDAAVGFMVAEKSHSNSWEQVAQFVHEFVSTKGTDPEMMKQLRREFLVVEAQIRKDFSVSRLPGAWKSAKSTALNAVKNSVPLVGADGSVHPKTDIGKVIKAKKSGDLPMDVFVACLDRAGRMYDLMSTEDQLRALSILNGFTKRHNLRAPLPVTTSSPLRVSAASS